MRILVTGSTGFIGFHVVQKLLERGDVVIGLDNLNDYYDTSTHHKVGLIWQTMCIVGVFRIIGYNETDVLKEVEHGN